MIESTTESDETVQPSIPVEACERLSEFARNARRQPAPPQPRIQRDGIRSQAMKLIRR
jgi:hypothetical protein